MSSERAGTPTSDKWEVVYEYDSFDDAEGAYVGADRPYDRALPGSPTIRRAGVPTHGRLDRGKARDVLSERWAGFADVNEGDSQDQRATVRLTPKAVDLALDALEACVLPHPRLDRIEALCDEWAGSTRSRITPDFAAREVRAALRGDE